MGPGIRRCGGPGERRGRVARENCASYRRRLLLRRLLRRHRLLLLHRRHRLGRRRRRRRRRRRFDERVEGRHWIGGGRCGSRVPTLHVRLEEGVAAETGHRPLELRGRLLDRGGDSLRPSASRKCQRFPRRGSRGEMEAAPDRRSVARQFSPAPAQKWRAAPSSAAAPRRRRCARLARAAAASRTRRGSAAQRARAAAAKTARAARRTAGAAGGAAWRRRRATAASRR